MHRLSFLVALMATLPVAAQQSYDLSGDHVAIYNIAGTHTLIAGSGNAVREQLEPADPQGSRRAAATASFAAPPRGATGFR